MIEKKIDVGCGTKPVADFDAYTDIYESEQVKNNQEIKSKFVKTPAENLSMFKNKEFDDLRCHHVIEHVQDPNKACAEICRISKKGTLWFPTVQAEILFGRNDHNWIVFQIIDRGHTKPNRLLFIKKRFESFYGHGGRRRIPQEARPYVGLEQRPFTWEGEFKWTVVL